MKWGGLSADLQSMKEKMEHMWDTLSEESPIMEEREMWQWVEKLPKFEGTGRRTLQARSNKTIKS